MLQKFYNRKTNILALTGDSISEIEDKEFKNIPKSRINKYSDTNGYIFNSYYGYKDRPNLKDFVSKIQDYTFGPNFNYELYPGNLPDCILYLTFGSAYNQKICFNTLPKNLISLTFGHSYNQELRDKVLPESLNSITFGKCYNQQIRPRVLPDRLISLKFGDDFNQIILENSLPDNLKELIFGYEFNQNILKKSLPRNFQILTFGHNFNSQICSLPTCLTQLTFGHDYNRTIERDVLPRSLKILYFHGSKNNSNTINTLPETVEEIALYNLEANVSNLPLFFKKVKVMANVYEKWDQVLKIKVPFGCVITDKTGTELNVD